MIFAFAQFVINLSSFNYPNNFEAHISTIQLNRGKNWTIQTSKFKFFILIIDCIDFAFWRFSMIFTFVAFCSESFQTKTTPGISRYMYFYLCNDYRGHNRTVYVSVQTLLQIALKLLFCDFR